MSGARQGRILVIGAGVSGLSTALVLARRGWQVIIAADQFTPTVTSTVAGALWEWPPSVCGRHHDERLLARSTTWATLSYRRFAELADHPARTGVYLRDAVFYFRHPVHTLPAELAKMTEIAAHVPGFVHDPGLIADNGVNPDAGVVDAYSYRAPMVDTDRHLGWLQHEVLTAGCHLIPRRITGRLVEQERALRAEFGAAAIVNCTGLGARGLAGDTSLFPHRGAVLRVYNTGEAMPRITQAHCVANDPTTPEQDMIFIVPRGEDRLVLGGLVEPDQWDTDLGLDTYSPIRDILRRTAQFLPILADATIDEADPVRVGLRPFRAGSVRLQVEPGTRIVHNYGHGGAGVTLSWGCAEEIAGLTERLLAGQAAA